MGDLLLLHGQGGGGQSVSARQSVSQLHSSRGGLEGEVPGGGGGGGALGGCRCRLKSKEYNS